MPIHHSCFKNPIVEIANGNLTVDKDVQFLKLLTAFRP